MVVLYTIGISFLRFTYWLASWFNPKAKAFRRGRRQQVERLGKAFPRRSPETWIWFHCASLGEFEQGRPIIERLKSWKPGLKILLTFFSPSGFEASSNYPHADYIFYLPWDTPKNANWFASNLNPSLVVFVKYEFWYHYALALHKRNIPLISISSIFRPGQIFFRPYGSLFRSLLKYFNHLFVQNQESVALLHSIGVTNVTLAGDSRFDRVYQIIQQAEEIPIVHQFKNGQKLMVIGSAWPEDMAVLFPFINENRNRLRFIIAPHEITEDFLRSIEQSIEGKSVRLSLANSFPVQDASVMLIDNVGMLSRLYRYGEFAFVGGAFGKGLHNILEAACYGVPVFFGNQSYQNYQEAVDLVQLGGAFEVANFVDLKSKYEALASQPAAFQRACEVTRQYVLDNLGATDTIVEYCKKFLA